MRWFNRSGDGRPTRVSRCLGRRAVLVGIVGGLLLGSLVWTAGLAHANTPDLTNFNSLYGTAATKLNDCKLCHTTPIPQLNSYGAAYKNAGRDPQAFMAIEPLDSDNDGWTNLAEIQALFFPGDAADAPGAGVTLTPAATTQTSEPGVTATYTLQITNTGNATDSFDVGVAVSGQTWTTNLPTTVNSLASGASANLLVRVAIPGSAADGDTSTATVTGTSRGNSTISATATLTTTVQRLLGGAWSPRFSPTSSGKLLLARNNEDVLFFDGAEVRIVQLKGGLDNLEIGSGFALGSGASSGQVIGAWRRGTDFAWVWVKNSGEAISAPTLVAATTRFGGTSFNPEWMVVADGCVFMVLQSPSGDTTLVKDVFQINPANGVGTLRSGSIPVVTGATNPNAGAARITTSGCQAAWLFDPHDLNTSDDLTLYFYNGSTLTQVDAGSLGEPHLSQGRFVYTKTVGGIGQVFVYDSTVASPAPVQLTFDTSGQNSNPQTDGQHVAWLRTEADGTTRNVVLNGGLVVTNDPTMRPAAPGQEPPIELQRGQIVWKDAGGSLRYYDGKGIRGVDIAPSTTFDRQWLADSFIAYHTEINNFLFAGTPPVDLSQPAPPLLVVATPGSGEVTVTWDKVLGVSSYNLYMAQQVGVTKDNYLTLPGGSKISGATSPVTVTSLTSNQTYHFVVTAVAGGVEGPISREAAATLVGTLNWQSVGNVSGFTFNAVAADRTNASVAYAGGSGSGSNCGGADKVPGCDVYKTTDGGATWAAVTGAVNRIDVRALAVHGSIVYAATRDFFGGVPSRILRSSDGGSTWQAVVPDGGNLGELNKSLAIDPNTPTTLYAGDLVLPTMDDSAGDSFVIQSINSGQSWAHLLDPVFLPGAEIRAYAIAVDPVTPKKLYAGGTGTPNLAKSKDGGVTWSNAGFPGPGASVYSLAIDPTSPSTLYAGTSGFQSTGVHKSTDNGRTWTLKNNGLPTPLPGINSILIDPANPSYIHLGTDAGYFYSIDDGESWTATNGGLTTSEAQTIRALTITPTRHLIAATAAGLFLLTDFSIPEVPQFTLTVALTGTGSGTVTSSPAGITCGMDCSEPYSSGTVITLTAAHATGSTFGGWTGDADCGNGTITLSAPTACTATFNLVQAGTFALTVSKDGTGAGSGTVTSSPVGIMCDPDCSEAYPDGTVVTLSASAATGAVFAGWGGDCSNATGPCMVTMDAAKSVTATFSALGAQGAILEFDMAASSVGEKGTATITVMRTGDTTSKVTVQYGTSDGTAIGKKDYTPKKGKLTFKPNVTSQMIKVSIRADKLDEEDETVLLTLSNPNPTGGAALGPQSTTMLTIEDDDEGGILQFGLPTFTVGEKGSAKIIVTRTGGLADKVTVQYATSNGTAMAGEDYTTKIGTLKFGAGKSSQTIKVPIRSDKVPEGDETVLLTLSDPTGGAVLGAQFSATLTILDDDD